MLAVADAFDVMTATRIYSAARSREDALAECERLVGAQFAPEPVAALAAMRGAETSQRLPGDPEALRAQRRGHDAAGEAPAVEVGLGDEPLGRRERLGGLEQAQDRVGEAHVLERAPDAAVLDEEGPVACGPGHLRGLLVHDVQVPQARHVETALDRRHQLGLVGGAPADEHEVGRRGAVGRAAGGEGVAGGRRPRAGGRPRVVHHRLGHALADERQRVLGYALGVDGARQRARGLRRVGQVDARRRDPLAEAPDERAAALGVGEPVEGQAAEELEQRADGVVLQHHRVFARCEPDRLLAGDLGRRARGQRVGVERGDRAPRPGRPARSPALVSRDDLHERVGHAVQRAHAGGRGDGRVDRPPSRSRTPAARPRRGARRPR